MIVSEKIIGKSVDVMTEFESPFFPNKIVHSGVGNGSNGVQGL